MRGWQDDFHRTVSQHVGHDRIGPRRQRLRRDAALARRIVMNVLEQAARLAGSVADMIEGQAPNSTDITAELHRFRALTDQLSTAKDRLAGGRPGALEKLQRALDTLSKPDGEDLKSSSLPQRVGIPIAPARPIR